MNGRTNGRRITNYQLTSTTTLLLHNLLEQLVLQILLKSGATIWHHEGHSHVTGEASYLTVTRSSFSVLPITIHRCTVFSLSSLHFNSAITFTRNHFIFHCIDLGDGFFHSGATERLCCYLQKYHKDTRTN